MKRPKKKVLLVRVAIDSSEAGGRFNAPANLRSRKFCYLPIPQSDDKDWRFRRGMTTRYNDERLGFVRALARFREKLPDDLRSKRVHLDPDYRHLSYGDGKHRGGQIANREEGENWLIFYSSFRDRARPTEPLIYAITGVLRIETIKQVQDVPSKWWHKNAHTRCDHKNRKKDWVVFGNKRVSGRLEKFIEIGYRTKPSGKERHGYYLLPRLEKAWGHVSSPYLQRSRTLISLKNPEKFLGWLRRQKKRLVHKNN